MQKVFWAPLSDLKIFHSPSLFFFFVFLSLFLFFFSFFFFFCANYVSLNVKCHTNRKQCKLKFHIKKRRKKVFLKAPSSTSVCESSALFLNIAGWSHLGGQTGWFDSGFLSGILSVRKHRTWVSKINTGWNTDCSEQFFYSERFLFQRLIFQTVSFKAAFKHFKFRNDDL